MSQACRPVRPGAKSGTRGRGHGTDRRGVAGAAVLGGNGLAMLFAGLWWYGVVPGVTATGPYNPHFVRDIGAAYLVAGAGRGLVRLEAARGLAGARRRGRAS